MRPDCFQDPRGTKTFFELGAQRALVPNLYDITELGSTHTTRLINELVSRAEDPLAKFFPKEQL